MSDELLGLSFAIIIITFIVINFIIFVNKNITTFGKITSVVLIIISSILNAYIVSDYQRIRNNQYEHTEELIIAQRHLLNISDYVFTLEKEVNNNNVFNNWCDNEVLQRIKKTADSVNTLNQDYDNFLNNK
ncbi:MAG: hypothetical protein MR765_04040 [Tenericutes bacterium]|nr:hypothetical protein [Mycoplasmatota bacterium]